MESKRSLPNSISHKDLDRLLKKASKEDLISDAKKDLETLENEEFNELLLSWSEKSYKLVSMLEKKDCSITKGRNSKSIMAMGAIGAHLNMALQALRVIELDN